MVLRTALMKKLTFLKATSAVTEEILKATSTDINRLLKVTRNLLKKSGKLANPGSFWKSFRMCTVSFRKLFCDCTDGFPNP